MNRVQPLVSIGLPTYNRVHSLKRAVDSVLTQDHTNLELIISDNASTDETEAFCQELQHRDSRVRYVRNRINRGALANFRAVLHEATGEYFMWLADDDWLSDHYISSCADFLTNHQDCSMVHGTESGYTQDGSPVISDIADMDSVSQTARVLTYYRQVWTNGAFYGLSRRSQLADIPLRDLAAADWFMVAELAFLGKVKRLEDIFLYRITREEASLRRMRQHHGLPLLYTMLSYLRTGTSFLIVPLHAGEEIWWKSSAYRHLNVRSRLKLGASVVAILLRRNVTTLGRKAIGIGASRARYS